MNNTVGIIDSDYFFSDNEGHIFMKITNDSNEGKTVEVPAGTGFAQGIFSSMASRKMMMRKESVTAASEAPRSNR